MKTIIILHHQDLFDVAIEHTGNVENAFAIALANQMAVSDELTPGHELIIPEQVVNDEDILGYYTTKNLHPATGYTASANVLPPSPEGIGYWTIDLDFKVS